MGKRLYEISKANPDDLKKDSTCLLVDDENFTEGKKVLLKDIDLEKFNTDKFYNKSQTNNLFVKSEEGKGLSDNNFTSEYIDKIDSKADKKELDRVESIASGANQAVVFNNYEELVETFLKAKVGDFKKGQNILIADLGVPDLWIGFSTIIFHNTTAEDFERAIRNLLPNNENGQMTMIGHYGFSVLETQKVDLTNYVEKTELETELTDYVKNTDFANSANGGVVKMGGPVYGITIRQDGIVQVEYASESEIAAKEAHRKIISPKFLDYAIKTGMTTNVLEWTDDEKVAARDLISAAPYMSPTAGILRAWTSNGAESVWANVQSNASTAANGFIAKYMASTDGDTSVTGYMLTNTPKKDYQCANKKYVDDAMGGFDYELIDEITLEEAVNKISIPLNKERKSIKIYIKSPIVTETGSATFTGNNLNLALVSSSAFSTTQAREMLVEIDVIKNFGTLGKCKHSTNNSSLGNETTSFNDGACDLITNLSLVRSKLLEVGTTLKIWANK